MSPRAANESSSPREANVPSLRARLWIGVLGATVFLVVVVSGIAAALWWGGPEMDPRAMALSLLGAAAAGLLAALLFAQWLERGIVSGLRRLLHTLSTGQPPERRDLEQSPEWGEIAQALERLTEQLQQHRTTSRAAAELQLARAEVLRWSEAIEQWMATERWQPVETGATVLSALAETLNRAMARQHGVMDRNQEAARLVSVDLHHTLDEARESADEAEHGFVEANALLTTVREIARVGVELQQLSAAPGRPVPDRGADWRRRAAESLEGLVTVSSQSVEHLGNGLLRVQEVAAQVQVLSNRATLIALNALLSGEHPAPAGAAEGGDDWATDLKQLAREVRAATERVAVLSTDVAREVEAANARMSDARTRVLQALESGAEPEAQAAAEAPVEVARLGERLREMVQDALRKGERMSEAGERTSRAAERLVRRLEDQSRDLEGLVARLTPTGELPAQPAPPRPAPPAAHSDPEATARTSPETPGRSGESPPRRLKLFTTGVERADQPDAREREERP